jgi:hypothetical protein
VHSQIPAAHLQCVLCPAERLQSDAEVDYCRCVERCHLSEELDSALQHTPAPEMLQDCRQHWVVVLWQCAATLSPRPEHA